MQGCDGLTESHAGCEIGSLHTYASEFAGALAAELEHPGSETARTFAALQALLTGLITLVRG